MLRRLIRPADHRLMPWKNGQGMTAEIAIDPPEGDVATGFRWRLSIAEVGADGPFSAFPGYDRTIMLIAGNGMELRFADGRVERLDRRFEPFTFRGEDALDARLIQGPVRDFNLMVRREALTAAVGVLALAQGRQALPALGHGTTLILHALEGGSSLDDGTVLAPGDTLVVQVEAQASHAVAADGERSLLFVARLSPRH
ncbi:MAG: HutD family protein [Pseudomonadota bacterium]